MGTIPFEHRVVALVVFLGVVSSVELVVKRGRAVRWRGSLAILLLGAAGAAIGVGIDLVTSSISPAYFAIGKELGWEAGLQRRALVLGAQAGSSAGAIAGCVLVYANGRTDRPQLPIARVLAMAAIPLTGAILAGCAFGVLCAATPISNLLQPVMPVLPTGHEEGFAVVWATHLGLYGGALCGLIVAVRRILKVRRELGSPTSPVC